MRIPTTAEFALNVVDDWLTQSGAVVVTPTPNHVSVLRQLLATTGAAGNLVNDGHLAALAIEHHATVCSFDSDFDRFVGVRRLSRNRQSCGWSLEFLPEVTVLSGP